MGQTLSARGLFQNLFTVGVDRKDSNEHAQTHHSLHSLLSLHTR